MKFSTIFTAVLSALSLGVGASPVPDENVNTITKRDINSLERRSQGTDNFAAVEKVHSDLEQGHYYVFTQTWPPGAVPPRADHESKEELEELQKKLGYDHIAIFVGKVGGTKTRKTFDATRYDLYKDEKDDVGIEKKEWKTRTDRPIQYIGTTTEEKVKAFEKDYDSYAKAHPKYNVQSNNCDDYVNAAKKELV